VLPTPNDSVTFAVDNASAEALQDLIENTGALVALDQDRPRWRRRRPRRCQREARTGRESSARTWAMRRLMG